MSKIISSIVLLVVVIGGGWYLYTHPQKTDSSQLTGENFGTYQYECDEHVTFNMTLASDTNSIYVAPANGGAYPPASTLMRKETVTAAARYEGSGVIFTATGETVTLGEGDSAINCSPVPSADMAPFNFGDAGAGSMDGGGNEE